MSDIRIALKDRLLNTYVFIQLFYSIREIWWGFAATYLHFGLNQLDRLANQVNSTSLILLGVFGLVGAFTNSFVCNIMYSTLNVFVFASIAITFYTYAPETSGGGNYTIETLGAIWLAYRTNLNRHNSKEGVK